MFGPRPLPAGGTVTDQCRTCKFVEDCLAALTLSETVAKCYYTLKLRVEKGGAVAEERALELTKKQLDWFTNTLRPLINQGRGEGWCE
jgi:hypothetical protein